MEDAISVVAGQSTSMAIKKDGSLWVWGNRVDLGNIVVLGSEFDIPSTNPDYIAQLRENILRPLKIMTNVQSVSVGGGGDDTIVVAKKDGTVYTYSIYTNNQGTGATEYREDAPRVGKTLIDNVVAVNAGATGTMAIKNDGTLWYWGMIYERGLLDNMKSGYIKLGENGLGGDNNSDYGFIPKPIKVMDNVVACSLNGTMAQYNVLKTDGTLYVWGGSGISLNEEYIIPTTMENVKTFGGNLIVKKDNTLWGTGSCEYGQLANGSTEGDYSDAGSWAGYNRTIGTYTQTMSDVEAVSANPWTTFVLKTDGSLWACGLVGFFSNMIGTGKNGDAMAGMSEDTPVQLTPVKILDNVMLPSNNPKKYTVSAVPTPSAIRVDGQSVSLDAYNINSNNYCKIRDVAQLLNGTGKQFNVIWDNDLKAVSMTSNQAYVPVGGELAKGDGSNKNATLNTAKIYLDGKVVNLTAYTINGNNYIKLRDLGQTFDFGVSFDKTLNAVVIDTSTGYTAE